ncbi:MAG TPA: T9SS type A sorting domain-containing protein, partial [Candidatus Kapabacteria bacterium]|nr:T9SS type A sorting domain-containing protein [Candidatus Kapabacteria bacterium]
NYPNPLNAVTVGTSSFYTDIPVFLNHNGHITVKIFDQIGRYVKTLADGDYSPGPNAFIWDATSAQNGVYYCQMEAEGQVQIKKIIVQK